MPVSRWFLIAAALFALTGMFWGIQMAASQDHMLSPAHGHLNLLGFVACSIFGFYYALTPAAAASRLARVHFGLAVGAVVLMAPGIALAIQAKTEALALTGSVVAVLSMLAYIVVLMRFGIGSARASG